MASQASASRISAYTGISSQYQSTLASSGLQRETLGDRLTQTKNWIYHPENRTLMGRTLQDWLFLAMSIGLFLFLLIGVTGAFCALLYWAIDWNLPELQGANSILQTPGMSFRPQPYLDSTLIRFVKGDGSTYMHYLDHIEAYIQYYENERHTGDKFAACKDLKARRPELNKICAFEVQDLGGDCVKQQNYGFDDGQPCVLLKLNKVFDWVPEEYTNETVPDSLRDVWSLDHAYNIFVKCDGDDDATRENMGDLTISPTHGFHFKYYPFRNQQGYRSPLAFVRFENPVPGVLLMMTCRAYARNIVHDRVALAGLVHFEMMVD